MEGRENSEPHENDYDPGEGDTRLPGLLYVEALGQEGQGWPESLATKSEKSRPGCMSHKMGASGPRGNVEPARLRP